MLLVSRGCLATPELLLGGLGAFLSFFFPIAFELGPMLKSHEICPRPTLVRPRSCESSHTSSPIEDSVSHSSMQLISRKSRSADRQVRCPCPIKYPNLTAWRLHTLPTHYIPCCVLSPFPSQVYFLSTFWGQYGKQITGSKIVRLLVCLCNWSSSYL